LNMIAMIGTSDRLCWLAETCKILLLLLGVFLQHPYTGWHPESVMTQTGLQIYKRQY